VTDTIDTTISPLDERLMNATIGTLELFGVYLGVRLGLYENLQSSAMTVPELAERAGIHPRYAQEWLEQQAVAGVLVVEAEADDAHQRRYALPEAHVGVLADPDDASHLAPFAQMVVGIAQALDDVVAAYRTGTGVPYARYGADFRHGQGNINRPAFSQALVPEWLAAVDGVTEALANGGRLADLGCGHGWSTIAVARAFPGAEVIGVDSDAASIEDARGHAARSGVDVRFACADASLLAEQGPFDVILLLEALHDLSRPDQVLAAARQALAADGVLVVADELVAPAFTAPGDDIERMMYGWSITACLPAAMAETPSLAIGTVIRESTVRELAAEAGFGSVTVADVDAGFFRIYALRP
jgi:2-polyprenyl-3-methyl-5-hydroxy-6-metoxy-1,4-benzoquinol methylase